MRFRLRLDTFTLILLGVIAFASFFPAQGDLESDLSMLANVAVALLFFIHGAGLSREEIRDGATHWRLHLFISALTFVVFPILVLPIDAMAPLLIPKDLALGFLYLGVLPSAVSSSIAFTAMARGNVPAAVCSAAGSNVLGMMLTPFLLMLLVSTTGDGGFRVWEAFQEIVLQLLLPFAIGHGLRPWLARWFERYPNFSSRYDQAVILLIVYVAFSQSVTGGLWQQLPISAIVLTIVLCLVLLMLLIGATMWIAPRLGFNRADEIAAVFCGSKKSLASGLPMAKVLFAAHPGFGMIVLPIICYNQIQILVGAVLAQRYQEKGKKSETAPGPAA